MTNKNIDLPSQRAHLLMEIEQPLRRKFRSETPFSASKGAVVMAYITFGFLVLMTALYFFVGRVVDYQATQHQMVKQAMAAENDPLCRQYLRDTKLAGTAAEETINQICN